MLVISFDLLLEVVCVLQGRSRLHLTAFLVTLVALLHIHVDLTLRFQLNTVTTYNFMKAVLTNKNSWIMDAITVANKADTLN